MSEMENGGEHLSEDEIKKEIDRIYKLIGQYNNLNASVRAGGHYMLKTMQEIAEHATDDEFNKMMERYTLVSDNIAVGMSEVGLASEDGVRVQRIDFDRSYTMDDLIFLREYIIKMDRLYDFLQSKGCSDEELGVVKDE